MKDHNAPAVFVVASFVMACSAKVARLPLPGETLAAEGMLLEPGGKGLNVAVGARRLGVVVDGVMAVGEDRFGDLAAEVLAREGLPSAMLVRLPGQTGAGVGMIDAAGENVIAVFAGANARLSADDVAKADARLAASGIVVAQFETGDAPIAAAFARARALGIATALNPSPYRAIAPAIVAATDILVVNATEAAALCADLGVAAEALPERLFALGVEALVVTRGVEGATLWRRGEGPLHQPAFPVLAVDAIGAGDAFLAGLLAGIGAGRGWAESLRLAAACGVIVVARDGVLDALPDAAQLAAFMDDSVPAP